jgi:hypothetical protein
MSQPCWPRRPKQVASASKGISVHQIAWMQTFHARSETYRAARACVTDAHTRHPHSRLWGNGTTSSSDGQSFRASDRAAKRGDINLHYGSEPGSKFYSHLSDQYGYFSILPVSPTESEAAIDMPLNFHPAAIRSPTVSVTPQGGRDVVPLDTVILGPGEYGVRGELGSVVGNDHDRLAAMTDQIGQLTCHPTTGAEVSGITARHSRVTSSTMFSTRKRRPQANWSCTKSSDQRAFGRASTRIGAQVPTARRRARRLRTVSLPPGRADRCG